MIEVCSFHEGTLPLLVSVPHDGCHIPDVIRERMTPAALALQDTDWHVSELYDFARDMGASMIVANYSRYVIDLNRPAGDEALYEGQVATGLCPESTFGGEAIYRDGGVSSEEKAHRVARYWRPYHDTMTSELARMRAKHGVALLWDAHSIASSVPRLFDGQLPILNIGTNGGASCSPRIAAAARGVAEASRYSWVLDGRFRGGHITRHYGRPVDGVHAVQLELAQRAYMDEQSAVFDRARTSGLVTVLRSMLEACLQAATS